MARFTLRVLPLVAALALAAAPAQAVSPETAIVKKVNKIRSSKGLPKLRTSRSLSGSARAYARWMMARDFFGHVRPIRASRRFRVRGEVLARHAGVRPRAGSVVRSWMRSPAHRYVLLSRRFKHIGVGRAPGRLGRWRSTVWVAHVGARRR